MRAGESGRAVAEGTLELRRWADAVEAMIARGTLRHVNRVMVFAETGSTQDAAMACGGGEPGLLVLAGRQSAGRGRLGRAWDSGDGLGVAATFTIGAPRERHSALALAAGLGTAEAIERCLPATAAGVIGLRWPNDAVERASGRKLAGVLVESRSETREGLPLLMVGVGINVLQRADDFPPGLRADASSVRMLGGEVTRLAVIEGLIERFDAAAGASLGDDEAQRAELLERWKRRDVLTGRPGVFVFDGRTYEGIVMEILPDLSLRLRMGEGSTIELPAAATSLVRTDSPTRRRGAKT